MWRYTGQTDLIVGMPFANRDRVETEGLIGLLVNTLVLRTKLDPAADFNFTVSQVRETCLDAYDHRDLPFEILVDRLNPERSLGYNPLFQVCCVLLNEDLSTLNLSGLQSESLPAPIAISKFDLTLYIEDLPDRLRLIWEYDADLFAAERIRRMAGHFERLLQFLVNTPDRAIAHAPLMAHEEREQLRQWARGPEEPVAWENVVEAIESAAAARPDQVAVVCGPRRLTLHDLNARANRLAWHLQDRGVTPGDIAAICLPRGVEAVIAILAALKTGAAYLPLDPNLPPSRVDFILRDSTAKVLVTNSPTADRQSGSALVCSLDLEEEQINARPADNLPSCPRPSDRAYVIYTSGSTGQPKGAAVYHRGFANLLQWYQRFLHLGAEDKTLLISAPGFDLTQKNLFAPLLAGGTLFLPADDRFDPVAIVAEIGTRGITHINCTPSAFYPLTTVAGSLQSLRHVVLGGEPIQISKLENWLRHAPSRRACLQHLWADGMY